LKLGWLWERGKNKRAGKRKNKRTKGTGNAKSATGQKTRKQRRRNHLWEKETTSRQQKKDEKPATKAKVTSFGPDLR